MKYRSLWRLTTLTLGLAIVLGAMGIIIDSPRAVPVADAQTPVCGGAWDAYYYSTQNFTPQVAYQCLTAASDGGLTDNFTFAGIDATDDSAFYTRYVNFPQIGTYTFYGTVEDGIQVSVNGTLVIDQLSLSTSPRTINQQVNITSNVQLVTVRFIHGTGNRQLDLHWTFGSTGGATATQSCNTSPSIIAPWFAEFYNGTNFSGSPVATATFNTYGFSQNWGQSSPASGVNADNWGVRLTRVVDFQPGGTTTFTMTVDDIASVWLDGTAIMASAPFKDGANYTSTQTISAGQHTVVILMVDFTLDAFINVDWTGASTGGGGTCGSGGTTGTTTPGATSVSSPTGVTATVTANVGLNFRECPSFSCNKITLLPDNTTYAVIGRTEDSVWANLLVNGQSGWALAEWLSFSGDFNSVPVTWQEPGFDPALGEGIPIRAVGNVRIRECPSTRCARLTYVPWGTRVLAFGKNSTGYWIKVGYNDAAGVQYVGWSSAFWYFNDEFKLPLPELPVIAE